MNSSSDSRILVTRYDESVNINADDGESLLSENLNVT